jgi:WD40 repeat protein
MHQTEKHGANLTKRQRKEQQALLTAEEKVFGKSASDDNAASRTYQTDWVGHEHAVTSIAILVEDMQQRMISGDEAGKIRIWDIESRTCLNVIKPWSHESSNATKAEPTSAAPAKMHPVSSILIVPQPSDSASSGMFASPAASNSKKAQSTIANLVTTLQKFNQEAREDGSTSTLVPFLKANRTTENLNFWEAKTITRKRKLRQAKTATPVETGSSSEELRDAKEEILKLQQELEAKRAEVARWEDVNNKLMTKLKSKK